MKDFNDFLPELTDIRHRIHENPELGLEEFETSDLVADLLEGWGFEVTRGLGKTGVVGTLRRPGSNRTIGLRADMDALPIVEETALPYASRKPGKMHACGHDGHTSMLLGAAWRLAHDPDFKGTAHLIFQPAEETIGGGAMMVADGLFRRFPCDRVFAMHNDPGLPVGYFRTRPGAMTAAIDAGTLIIHGKGGHGAHPEQTIDPIMVGSSIVMALQSIVGRNISPHQPAVVTVGAFVAGTVNNIIPASARLELSLRSTDPALREDLRQRVIRICTAQAEGYGARVEFSWHPGYPASINNADAVDEASRVIAQHFGPDRLTIMDNPMMGSEDFSFFLEQVPGAYLLIGNGDSSGVHTAQYDFNDGLLEPGSRFFHRIVRQHCDM